MKRICKYCGAAYDGAPDSSCCPDCAKAQRETTLRDRTCRACGKIFPGGPRAWYCPACRLDRRREADRRHKRTGTARPLGSTDACEICGRPYTVQSARQRYCPACAPEAVREKDRQASRDWNAENLTPEARRAVRQTAAAEIPCVICGKGFVPHDASVTCSPSCSAELTRRNRAVWEKAHRAERNAYCRARYAKKADPPDAPTGQPDEPDP